MNLYGIQIQDHSYGKIEDENLQCTPMDLSFAMPVIFIGMSIHNIACLYVCLVLSLKCIILVREPRVVSAGVSEE